MKNFFILLCILHFSSKTNAQQVNSYSSVVPNHYFSFMLKLTKESNGFTPPVAARAFGFTGLTLYESCVNGMSAHLSLVNKLHEFNSISSPILSENYHWPTVANNALSSIIDSLWKNSSQVNKDSLIAIRDFYNNNFQNQLSAADFNASKNFGINIANDIFNYSKTDGCHESFNTNFPISYSPPAGPGLWEPTVAQVALQPYWGFTRPFVLENTTSTLPSFPPAFSTDVNSAFYGFANEVYNQVNNNTPEQVTIAQYWADGGGSITPPGHSISMLTNILIHENANLEIAALNYAKMGMAVSDAFKACWKTKYIYNCTRPITYIQDYIDPNWTPLIGTPPFPEYTSGHSSQSGAMSEILESAFGQSYSFIDSTHGVNFGGPRQYTSFDAAAEEAAISRLYGGIHFEFGNSFGLITGRKVGININKLFNSAISSVSENEATSEIMLYPNPTNDYMQLEISKNLKSDIAEILSINGKLIFQIPLKTNLEKLDLRELESGSYFIKVGDLTERFVKN